MEMIFLVAGVLPTILAMLAPIAAKLPADETAPPLD